VAQSFKISTNPSIKIQDATIQTITKPCIGYRRLLNDANNNAQLAAVAIILELSVLLSLAVSLLMALF
jgi:hypothetical protein